MLRTVFWDRTEILGCILCVQMLYTFVNLFVFFFFVSLSYCLMQTLDASVDSISCSLLLWLESRCHLFGKILHIGLFNFVHASEMMIDFGVCLLSKGNDLLLKN